MPGYLIQNTRCDGGGLHSFVETPTIYGLNRISVFSVSFMESSETYRRKGSNRCVSFESHPPRLVIGALLSRCSFRCSRSLILQAAVTGLVGGPIDYQKARGNETSPTNSYFGLSGAYWNELGVIKCRTRSNACSFAGIVPIEFATVCTCAMRTHFPVACAHRPPQSKWISPWAQAH